MYIVFIYGIIYDIQLIRKWKHKQQHQPKFVPNYHMINQNKPKNYKFQITRQFVLGFFLHMIHIIFSLL